MLLLTALVFVGVVSGIILLVYLNKICDWLVTSDVLSPSLIMLCTYLACMFPSIGNTGSSGNGKQRMPPPVMARD